MIFWIIGISGAGKTTVALAMRDELRQRGRSVVLLDGDDLRIVWGDDLGYRIVDRKRNHERISRLCALLGQEPKVDFIVPALSIFPELRAWNRSNIPGYIEVFLDTPLDVAIRRDPKNIYARAKRGEIRNVAGIDIDFPRPDSADLVIGPPDVFDSPAEIARRILTLTRPA